MENKKLEKNNKTKQFRLRGKKLLLIYPYNNNNDKIFLKKFLEQLTIKIKNIDNYIIAKYQNQIHCFIEMLTPIDISNKNYFDIFINNKNYIGNYRIGTRKQTIITSLIKENNFITNMILPVENGKLLTPDEHLFNICIKNGFDEAQKALYEYYPIIAMRRGSVLLKNLSLLDQYRSHKLF